MSKYYPDGDQETGTTVFGYGPAKALVQVLRQCGENLTRDNIVGQMTSLDIKIDVYLPGIRKKPAPPTDKDLSRLVRS